MKHKSVETFSDGTRIETEVYSYSLFDLLPPRVQKAILGVLAGVVIALIVLIVGGHK